MGRYFSAQLHGANELEQVFRRLPGTMSEEILVSSLRKGAKPIKDAARDNVPVRTGNLRDSIVVRKATKRQRRKGSGHIIIGFKKPHSRRAHLVEYGTRNSAAQPFMRTALNSKGGEAIERVASEISKQLSSAVEAMASPFLRKATRAQRRALGKKRRR